MTDTTLPTGFADLDEAELFRSALEDFALPVEKGDKQKVLLAAFLEGGVTWADYVAQHPEVAPEPVPVIEDIPNTRVPERDRGGVTTLPGDNSAALSVDDAPVATGRVRVQETPVYEPGDELLVVMERENALFGFRQYVFTDKNPFALMRPADAEAIVKNEDGFRIALPSELDEFYSK